MSAAAPRARAVPGVYHERRPRQQVFPRVRTDVAGFVGVGGPRHVHEAVAVNDWRDFEQAFLTDEDGAALEPPAGSRLAEDVRSFFANGGSRCWVLNVAERVPEDGASRSEFIALLLGLPMHGAGPARSWGLERLLELSEVSLVVLSGLHATHVSSPVVDIEPLPPRREESAFGACRDFRDLDGMDVVEEPGAETPVLDAAALGLAQRLLLERCERERWRAFALLSPPAGLAPDEAIAWRQELGSWSCGALYWPWLQRQEVPGDPVLLRSPVAAVAGLISRMDGQLGPHRAPANAGLRDAIGLEWPVDDRAQGLVYDSGVNVLRALPKRGLQLLGARTLRFDNPEQVEPLAFINVRRSLSAIERTAESIGQRLVFEPNAGFLWMRLTQSLVSYLRQLYEDGVLLGDSEDAAYAVRCDRALNPPADVEQGRLVCEVGVCIAAPAELIVFRLGRREGVIELEEV